MSSFIPPISRTAMVQHWCSTSERDACLFPFIERISADGGYQGPRVRAAAARAGTWKIEIIKRSDIAKGFVVLPKRWVVERPWLGSAATAVYAATSSATPE